MQETIIQNNILDENMFKNIVIEWANRIGVEPKEIHLRQMKNKWASLSEKGRLTFNTDLLKMHRKYCDYVIVHELLHMKVPNHGKLFKSLMYVFLPDWENLAREIGFQEI